jgi:hypothetical protein
MEEIQACLMHHVWQRFRGFADTQRQRSGDSEASQVHTTCLMTRGLQVHYDNDKQDSTAGGLGERERVC